MFDEFTGLDNLNEQQVDVILNSLKENSLVLAGAGSGKTKTLITRIEYLLKVLNVRPSSIMAITFTEKAAKELMTRAEKVTNNADEMTVGTYHSICLKLLINFGEDIGITGFKVLDKIQTLSRIRKVMVEMGLVTSRQMITKYMSKMSKLKNKLINPKMYRTIQMNKYNGRPEGLRDSSEYDFIEFYSQYQKKNIEDGYLDFDDIIMYTMALLQSSKNAKEYIKDTYRYIHADEVQDSNESNIRILNEFSRNANLFMVGDLDQSIYGFRDARPDYFLNLQNAGRIKIFRLEQNYRSTQTIVNASNEIISNNKNRIPKTCFSKNEVGANIDYFNFSTDTREASFVADEISMYSSFDEYKYSDFMVLYRTNAQSRAFEEAFLNKGIPYVLVGSLGFTDRAEVKDCLAFLRLYVNRNDKASFIRALKTLDGVGDATIKALIKLFDENKDALETLKEYKPKRESVKQGLDFLYQFLMLVNEKPTYVLKYVAEKIINKLETANNDKFLEKLSNIEELIKVAKQREDIGATVKEFVEQMDLISSSDDTKSDSVQLITVHSSKGLESKIVFVTGMNEGIFPHENSLEVDDLIEEERRAMYVACTRPMEKLYLTSYRENKDRSFKESRFISEIPNEYISKLKVK